MQRQQLDLIPQQRVIEKLDDYMSRRDYEGAERHLLFWLSEAQALGDRRGELMVRNELVGHFRKTGDKERAFEHAAAALQLVDALGFGEMLSAGTTYVNAATAYNAFGENEQSLELFRKAAKLYESSEVTASQLLGGLYNNMALACVALARFDEADELYHKALACMAKAENGQLEQAITYLNMADAVAAQGEAEEAEDAVAHYLDTAYELLNTPSVPRDGYYAFVCEKCAPVFAHYGYFRADKDLRARAQEIYGEAAHEGA